MAVANRLEQAVLEHIDFDEVARFESDMVDIPSFTTEEQELARFIHGFLDDHGVPVRLQEVGLANGSTSYNVIAKISGSGNGPSLTFIGHMDHSPTLGRQYANFSGWQRDPFKATIENGWLYGKGCQDEKGGLCAFLMAAVALTRAGFQPKGDVYFIPVQGHKRVSSGTLKLLESGHRTDYAVNSENSGLGLVPTWVGRSEGRITVRGKKLHFHYKDRFPELFGGQRTAMEHLIQILGALGPEMEPPSSDTWLTFDPVSGLPGYPQYRFEQFHFGGLTELAFNIQVRTIPGQTDEMIKRDLEQVIARLKRNDPTIDAEVTWPLWKSRPAVATPVDSHLVTTLATSHEEVFGTPPDISARGRSGAAADGSLTAEAGIQTVLYGPGGGESDRQHELQQRAGNLPWDERIALDDIVNATKVFALTAVRLCG